MNILETYCGAIYSGMRRGVDLVEPPEDSRSGRPRLRLALGSSEGPAEILGRDWLTLVLYCWLARTCCGPLPTKDSRAAELAIAVCGLRGMLVISA
jgi:hypothetical protein